MFKEELKEYFRLPWFYLMILGIVGIVFIKSL